MSTQQRIEFQDVAIDCRECHREFMWTAAEQQHFADKGLKHQPKRCRSCRTNKPTQPMPEMEISRGKVKWFNANKGYGFITPDNPENGDVYVHFSQIVGKGFVSLTTGQTVEFNIVNAEKGLAAVNVRVAQEAM